MITNPTSSSLTLKRVIRSSARAPSATTGRTRSWARARYAADIHLPGMLHGKILRSPHAHARIRGIDASKALALPGVHAVVTSADFPEVSAEIKDQEEGAAVNYGFYSRNVMAREKALYRGTRGRRHCCRFAPPGGGGPGADRSGLGGSAGRPDRR